MKLNIIRTILTLLLLFTFAIIFNFSSQDGEQSTGISAKVSNFIINIIHHNKSASEKEKMAKKIEPVVRKLAHFSIYMLVGILLMGLLSTYNLSFKKKIIICIIVGILYAASDEIHQLFVSERSGQIIDVLIDTEGAITGSLISGFICECIKLRR